MFRNLNDIGTEISELQGAMNSDSRGVGKDMIEASYKKKQIESAESKMFIANTADIFGAFEMESLIPSTEVGNIAANGPILATKIFSKLFHYESAGMIKILETIEEQSKRKGRGLNSDFIREVIDAYRSFIYSSEEFSEGDAFSERVRLLIDTKDNPSLAKRVAEAKQKPWGKRNYMMQRLITELAVEDGDPSTIKYIASTVERYDEQESTKSFNRYVDI